MARGDDDVLQNMQKQSKRQRQSKRRKRLKMRARHGISSHFRR
jgi:hypothetical protein